LQVSAVMLYRELDSLKFAELDGAPKSIELQQREYTLHPTPYTLHPAPYTLNPTPPKPYTLKPKT